MKVKLSLNSASNRKHSNVAILEFHNAETQTNRKVKAATAARFCRETQTYFQRNKTFQTPQDASTQMTKPGVHVSTKHDRIIIPGEYTLADTIEKRRENAAIVIQKYFRRYLAIEIVKHLKIDKARYDLKNLTSKYDVKI